MSHTQQDAQSSVKRYCHCARLQLEGDVQQTAFLRCSGAGKGTALAGARLRFPLATRAEQQGQLSVPLMGPAADLTTISAHPRRFAVHPAVRHS